MFAIKAANPVLSREIHKVELVNSTLDAVPSKKTFYAMMWVLETFLISCCF